VKINFDLFAYQSSLDLIEKDGKTYFLDPVRMRRILLQPEELVRQLWLQYLHQAHQFAFASMAVEKSLRIGERDKRYDLVIYDKSLPKYLFEFKSFKIALTQDACLQIAQYNLALKIPYLIISNGQDTYAFEVDHHNGIVNGLEALPF